MTSETENLGDVVGGTSSASESPVLCSHAMGEMPRSVDRDLAKRLLSFVSPILNDTEQTDVLDNSCRISAFRYIFSTDITCSASLKTTSCVLRSYLRTLMNAESTKTLFQTIDSYPVMQLTATLSDLHNNKSSLIRYLSFKCSWLILSSTHYADLITHANLRKASTSQPSSLLRWSTSTTGWANNNNTTTTNNNISSSSSSSSGFLASSATKQARRGSANRNRSASSVLSTRRHTIGNIRAYRWRRQSSSSINDNDNDSNNSNNNNNNTSSEATKRPKPVVTRHNSDRSHISTPSSHTNRLQTHSSSTGSSPIRRSARIPNFFRSSSEVLPALFRAPSESQRLQQTRLNNSQLAKHRFAYAVLEQLVDLQNSGSSDIGASDFRVVIEILVDSIESAEFTELDSLPQTFGKMILNTCMLQTVLGLASVVIDDTLRAEVLHCLNAMLVKSSVNMKTMLQVEEWQAFILPLFRKIPMDKSIRSEAHNLIYMYSMHLLALPHLHLMQNVNTSSSTPSSTSKTSSLNCTGSSSARSNTKPSVSPSTGNKNAMGGTGGRFAGLLNETCVCIAVYTGWSNDGVKLTSAFLCLLVEFLLRTPYWRNATMSPEWNAAFCLHGIVKSFIFFRPSRLDERSSVNEITAPSSGPLSGSSSGPFATSPLLASSSLDDVGKPSDIVVGCSSEDASRHLGVGFVDNVESVSLAASGVEDVLNIGSEFDNTVLKIGTTENNIETVKNDNNNENNRAVIGDATATGANNTYTLNSYASTSTADQDENDDFETARFDYTSAAATSASASTSALPSSTSSSTSSSTYVPPLVFTEKERRESTDTLSHGFHGDINTDQHDQELWRCLSTCNAWTNGVTSPKICPTSTLRHPNDVSSVLTPTDRETLKSQGSSLCHIFDSVLVDAMGVHLDTDGKVIDLPLISKMIELWTSCALLGNTTSTSYLNDKRERLLAKDANTNQQECEAIKALLELFQSRCGKVGRNSKSRNDDVIRSDGADVIRTDGVDVVKEVSHVLDMHARRSASSMFAVGGRFSTRLTKGKASNFIAEKLHASMSSSTATQANHSSTPTPHTTGDPHSDSLFVSHPKTVNDSQLLRTSIKQQPSVEPPVGLLRRRSSSSASSARGRAVTTGIISRRRRRSSSLSKRTKGVAPLPDDNSAPTLHLLS